MREKKKISIINKTMEMRKMFTKKAQRNLDKINNISYRLKALTFFAVLLALHIKTCACGHEDIPSQFSPKSINPADLIAEAPMLTTYLSLESTMDDTVLPINADKGIDAASLPLDHIENETREHVRVERSASPIVHDNFPKSGPNAVREDNSKEALAGRYFQYDIKPTSTLDGKILLDEPEQTLGIRTGKHLDADNLDAEATTSREQSFLLKGDSRPNLSGSPINPTNNTAILVTPRATASPHNARQNGNPDIQDIITGIVKLLNGNVNVHANTQGLRRPVASRINNRGPPRISDVQNLPIDYEVQKPPYGTSNRPPPYPFDRPERPFITGVPIPEQIVPIRPGFVSNRPPWHRNKPRPPITTTMGVRRPVNQYKPIPSTQMNPPAQDEELPADPTVQSEDEGVNASNIESSGKIDAAPPTVDTVYDTEFSGEDNNEQYIEVTDHDTETMDEVQEKKDIKKKATGGNKPKNNDKKKTPDYTTIIATSSVVNTVMDISSSYLPMPMDNNDELDPSSEEVIFMTQSKTPILGTTMNHGEENVATTPYLISITTSPLDGVLDSNPTNRLMLPTPNTNIPVPQVVTTAITAVSSEKAPINNIDIPTTTPEPLEPITTAHSPPATPKPLTSIATTPSNPLLPPPNYQPRPGIVLDDPEFKPGGRPRLPQRPTQSQSPPAQIQPTRQQLPPGYGEIFDVTLSAIQGPGSVEGSQQTINIKPYGAYGSNSGNSNGDIIVSASGDDGFVSIDGKRTYINLFGDSTDTPTGVQMPGTTPATTIPQLPGTNINGGGEDVAVKKDSGVGSVSVAQPPIPPAPGYGIPETEIVELEQKKPHSVRPQTKTPSTHSAATRPLYRQRTTQPPVRIDTCIVGDDSTCDQAQHERCKTENGVSSCHCRPGYSRRKHREPCRKVISFYLGLRVDRIYEHRIVWDNKLLDHQSEPYGQLSYEAVRAIDSAMSMTPYSDEFMDAKVNNIYRGDPKLGGSGVFVNMTLKLDESVETLRPNLRSDVQKHLLGVLHRRNNNIGNSVLYVTTPEGAISALHDLDECQSRELNDCHPSASCSNSWGAFRCSCDAGFRDPWADQPQRAGRDCQSCSDTFCNNRGTCSYNDAGQQVCNCESSYYGGQCEIDGEVLGVAIGASVAAVIIIVLTLVCLIMWSRRWQREQKNAIGSPVFGYMNTAPLKSAGMVQPGYQVTLEDRMRWAQIADVMAQSNHYGAEPIGPTRPSSAMFGYPNLQSMGLGTLGGLANLQNQMPMHQSTAPPVPLPRYERLGLGSRSNGMRTLENSSSSEEEDRTDLLGRNFQVPRPKSRSNGSIANQSGIYYDVDYEPSGNGIGNTSVDHLYGSQTHSHGGHGSGHGSGIPMSTYTSGRAPSNSYYMK